MDASTSKKDLEEEHTRELEIENAYKTYQEAISLQSKQKWRDAYAKYKELAASAVVVNHFFEEVSFIKGFQNGASNLQPDELSFIPQNVKKIRFLFFRNRGFLHFNVLRAGASTLDEILALERTTDPALSLFDLQKDLFYTMLDGFVNCLLYEEADESLLRILYDIYTYLDVRRLAKFTLEYCLSYPNETDEPTGICCLNDWAQPLWTKFQASGLAEESASASLSQKLAFLLPLKKDFIAQILQKSQFHKLSVSLKPGAVWLDVIHNLNVAMRDNQDKERVQDFQKLACKYFDPYVASETTLDDVSFSYSDGDTSKEPPADSHPLETPVLEVLTDEDVRETKDAKEKIPSASVPATEQPDPSATSEKSSMRLSKRLNPGDSAPVDADDIRLIPKYFIETELFFNNLNDSFNSMLNMDEPLLKDIVGHIVNTEPEGSEPVYIYDFLKLLNEWKPQKHEAILFPEKNSDSKRKSQSDKKRLIEVLTGFGNQFGDSKNNFVNLYDTQDASFVKTFISEKFPVHCHINQAKIEILSHLMISITTTTWDDQLYDAASDWVMQLESSYFEKCEREVFEHGNFKDVRLAMGIYEVLINSYIVTKEKLEHDLENGAHNSFVKSVKANFNTTAIELLRVKDRIEKWCELFKHMFSSFSISESELSANTEFVIRFYWASNYYVAAKSFSWRDKKFVVVHLHTLAELVKGISTSHIQIAYPNYSKIGEFSMEGLYRRLSTASILSIFSKILDQSDSETASTNETISLLESILFDEDVATGDENVSLSAQEDDQETGSLVSSVIHGLAVLDKVSLSSVKEFFYECPVDLKLSLWNILFSYYQKDSFRNFQKGLEYYLQFILDFLETPSYKGHQGDKDQQEEKQLLLLSLLASYRNHLETFLKYLSENKWRLPSLSITTRQLVHFSRIFELCYLFSLHEEAAFYTSRKISLATKSEPSFDYFKDFFIDSITILLAYCFNYISMNQTEDEDSMKSNLLILVHNQLGLRHLCDSSKGLFLRFAEDSLVTLNKLPETELTQIMSCRYHYKVKLDGQFPMDHYTVKSADLNKRSAEELAVFILPLCFRTNPLTQTPRNDLKQVVDDLFEIIGDPDIENDRALSANMVTVDKFIDGSFLGPRFIKEAFYGLKSLEIAPPQHPNRVAQEGLYFVEAVLMFNSYKIRKKSAQSRTVELERIITILSYDLVYGSDRVESWILLAQAYGYIVEDDLIWTSDKINTVERKISTANFQRKSLICYLMAISTITRHNITDSDSLKPVMNVLMNSFVKELYSASRSPMDMLAFQVHNCSKFVRQNDKTLFLKMAEKPSVTPKFCLALMDRCSDLAIKSMPEDWNSLYYWAKVKAKLNGKATDVLDILVKASAAAKAQSVPNDPILEPVYKFLSLLYKYVKTEKLSVEQGLRYLESDSFLAITPGLEAKTQNEYFQHIITGLKKLVTLDKKTWYHKPAYRQAIITFTEFGDVHGAKEVLSKYFTLRSNNKTFLQLWKPEHERPGKHFVYMFQYTQFYISLLDREQDLTSLTLMYPKLRRANSTMISLHVVWEQLCTSICTITRKILEIDPFHVRIFLASTTFSSFASQAKMVIEVIQKDNTSNILQKFLSLLHVITDIRKLNNGFGPTALIDYTFTGIFIRIFREAMLINPEIVDSATPDSPNGKSKKLAKRDLFPYTIDLATKCKRETELFLKYNPDIFNTYVEEYEREAEIIRQREAEEKERKLVAQRLKFSRLFAEQLILREAEKVDLAANFNQSRRQATATETIPERAPVNNGASIQSMISLSGPSNNTDHSSTFAVSRTEGVQAKQTTPTQISTVSTATENVQPQLASHGVGSGVIDTNYPPHPNEISTMSEGGLSNPAHNRVLVSQSEQEKLDRELAIFQGTVDDPVEIESDDGTISDPEPKRRLNTLENLVESASKRHRQE
ncbi:hypothetical protein JCM33374_g1425 [Metschnikowia sp. JCM 33374]|nr:hypothetical protein JCM33374_g1425 [Metschnikowia sp. JCM 33374]